MKGSTRIISILNDLLAGELTAMDQYFTHSRMFLNWGLQKLNDRIDHEMEDEKQHANLLINRILFLEGTPDLSNRAALQIGRNVQEMLQNDLQLELSVTRELKIAITACEEEQDYQTRAILEQMLADTEEDHTYWLEQQLGLIERVGLENYQQSQLG